MNPTQIDGKEWFLTVTRNMSFWHQCLLTAGWYHNTRDFGVESNLEVLSITVDGTHTHCFFYNPNYKNYLNALAEVFKDAASVDLLRKKYITYGNELLESLESCLKSLDEKSLSTFFNTYQKYTAGLMVTTAYSKSGTDTLTAALLAKGYTEAEIPEIIATITYPTQHTPMFTSQLDLVALGIDIQKNTIQAEAIADRLAAWVSNYGNIPVNYCDEPWTIVDAKKQLDAFLAKDCSVELVSMKKNHQDKIAESKNLLAKINDAQITTLAYGLAEGTYINEYRKNIFSTISLKYRPLFQKIANMAGSEDWRDCFYLMPTEMLDIVGGAKVSLAEIKKSRKVCGVMMNTSIADAKIKPIEKSVVDGLYEYVQKIHGAKKPDIDRSAKELKGFSASKGIVKGVVKIVLSSKEFSKVNIGDILVTAMTSVDFVPVMERAAAFVTNEGGIMCHASIVAREMGKPCIIGTKIATQLLKDGDMVEVNAEKGIVTILNG
ncbi:MAG: hypothetical protein RIT04_25 [Candidatus Parcubacteria bacterium]|jgi:phosphohistidine swiveling domain-containing protein/RNase H-fold protein (predicted Holliday junction resolvase)